MDESENKDKKFNFKNIFYERIKSRCKIFGAFVFIKTFIFVAHGKLLSLFDVLKQKWIKHISFDEDIISVFRLRDDENDDFDICVLLHGGKMKVFNQRSDEEGEDYAEDDELDFDVDGKIVAFNVDKDENEWAFVLSKNEDESFKLSAFHQRKMFDISSHIEDLDEETHFVFLFAHTDITEFIVQKEDKISLYQVVMGEEEPEIKQTWKYSGKNEDGELVDGIEDLSEKLHSGIKHSEKSMFLIDTLNFYQINLETNEIQTFPQQRSIGVFFSDNNYLYTLSHKRGDISSGFRLYDIENCINKGQDLSYLLSRVQVGCQGLIDFSHTNQRLVFLSSYDNIEVVPVLHRNTISFIGMSKRESYIATRVIDDKFIALSKKNQLTTWGTLNGKVRMEWNLSSNENLA